MFTIRRFIYDFVVYPFGIYSSVVVDRVTNNSTALTVVFGWNVVIKYVPVIVDLCVTIVG